MLELSIEIVATNGNSLGNPNVSLKKVDSCTNFLENIFKTILRRKILENAEDNTSDSSSVSSDDDIPTAGNQHWQQYGSRS
ncbi:unnamed protein product [Rhizophagus irregularis]|uniref:Uncharacterized protein n=1 Tax=Rhizophagus irregularis TaxID=588596 RepID=A0A915Z951_9GLOM|nr:unnamed protein product [Rhizophagus irregularis]CAB5365552.1 unnamed protein product [Rhizophagus irregularis]